MIIKTCMPVRALRHWPRLIVFLLAVIGGTASAEQRAPSRVAELVREIGACDARGLVHSAIGVTRNGTPIPCLVTAEDTDYQTARCRILLVGGLDGKRESVRCVLDLFQWFQDDASAEPFRAQFALSAVPCVNIDGIPAGEGRKNPNGADLSRGYPPHGIAYSDPEAPERLYLWRWIGMHAPDWVVEVRAGTEPGYEIDNTLWPKLAERLRASGSDQPGGDSLIAQLARAKPCQTGSLRALTVVAPGDGRGMLRNLFEAIGPTDRTGPSEARQELAGRVKRSPREVAEALSGVYGHDLRSVVYIPAVALIGRLRLSAITGEPRHLADVRRIAAPYFSGSKPSKPRSGSALSGHLIFTELAKAARHEKERARYIQLARQAADLGLTEQGAPGEVMPFHNEMSDALFMGGPILASVGRLTGDRRYYDACRNHLRTMRTLVLRDDGLYRHSPLDEAAWGRGNGFPALGLALCLSEFPEDHPGRAEILSAFFDHLQALRRHQDYSGCWHQVIDRPESYRELTSTCMITFAMIRGVRSGWLDRATYEPSIRRGWNAILSRIGEDGHLVDVCTGTGKQKSLRDYYDRKAILGRDARGGAMALLVATEMAAWRSE